MLDHFLEFKSGNRIETTFENTSKVIPFRDTFTSNGVDAIADSATMLNKKTVCRVGSCLKRMNFSRILKIIMEANRRYMMQCVMYK